MTPKTLQLPEAFLAAGLNVKVLDGWDEPTRPGYLWREPDGNPAGVMWHHTAGKSYTPNRDKAQIFLGMGYPDLDRLTMEDYGDECVPWVVVANAFPAPYTSGYGVRAVLEQFVKQDLPFVGRQTNRDDGPDGKDWAGNTHYINIENVCDGVGGRLADEAWAILPTVAQVINSTMGWEQTGARHITHSMHTRRKPDYRDGRYSDAAKTVYDIRRRMAMIDPNCPWTDDEYPPCERHYFPTTVGNRPHGNGPGENQGQCNVPEGHEHVPDWAFSDTGGDRWNAGNQHRYDWAVLLTEGREAEFEYRQAT